MISIFLSSTWAYLYKSQSFGLQIETDSDWTEQILEHFMESTDRQMNQAREMGKK